MRARVTLLVLGMAASAWAETREASLYPVRLAFGERTLAAEYMARSIPVPGGSLFTEDYLVIDVAMFGPKYDSLALSSSHFTLRMNGKKTPILSQTPGVVAGSLKYGDWSRPRLEAGAGVGNAGVVLGRPVPVERFPGDPTVRRLPAPPVPSQSPSAPGVEREQAAPVEEQIERAALAEGVQKLPLSGLLFFPYRGKPGSVKRLELEYEGPAGRGVLKVLP
jgi:hypothetical protein